MFFTSETCFHRSTTIATIRFMLRYQLILWQCLYWIYQSELSKRWPMIIMELQLPNLNNILFYVTTWPLILLQLESKINSTFTEYDT